MKIAVYSGTIPSTVFIERLIIGISKYPVEIYLFGTHSGKLPKYPSSVRIYSNKNKFLGVLQTISRLIHLYIRFPKRAHLLQKELNSWPWQSTYAFTTWKRHLPIILYLPDIFHIQWAKTTEQWLYLKKHFHVKLVLSLRGVHINYTPLVYNDIAVSYRMSFPQIDAFHAVSQAIGKEAVKYGADPNKIRVIYSGINALSPEAQKRPSQFVFPQGPFRLLAVGRFHWVKGYIYLLKALYFMRSKGLSVQLTLVASGNMPEELLYLIHELQLHDTVFHIKGLHFNGVQHAMRNHDALVLPSLEEGVANVVLEAMQIGLPVVSTNCGGMHEAINNRENGLLVTIRNPHAIADALEELMNMTVEKYNHIVKKGKDIVAEKFNLSKSVESFIRMYQTL